jgi:hypothetical protein
VGHAGRTSNRRTAADVSVLRLDEDAAVHARRTRRESVDEMHDVRSEVPRAGHPLGRLGRRRQISVLVAPTEPLRLRSPTLRRQPALDGSAPRPCRPPPRRRGRKGRGQDLGEPLAGGLSVAELGTVLRGGHREHTFNEPARKRLEGTRSLHLTERRGRRQVEAEFHARLGGIDGLTARPRRSTEPPLQLPLGHDDRACHAHWADHRGQYARLDVRPRRTRSARGASWV